MLKTQLLGVQPLKSGVERRKRTKIISRQFSWQEAQTPKFPNSKRKPARLQCLGGRCRERSEGILTPSEENDPGSQVHCSCPWHCLSRHPSLWFKLGPPVLNHAHQSCEWMRNTLQETSRWTPASRLLQKAGGAGQGVGSNSTTGLWATVRSEAWRGPGSGQMSPKRAVGTRGDSEQLDPKRAVGTRGGCGDWTPNVQWGPEGAAETGPRTPGSASSD